ncbi:MAG TPA: hypothetical protein VFB06_22820 [Streptosporangiaceae bacterium]|jgi:hypothetical protein|nr:hypothetical protein [Streptosporangiaceae bacterium]
MDQEQYNDRPSQDQGPPATRRKFLRQIGMTAAATAAVAGIADIAGMQPARAAANGAPGNSTLVRSAPPGVRKQLQEIRVRRGIAAPAGYNTDFCRLDVGFCSGGGCKGGKWCHDCCFTVSCRWSTRTGCALECTGGEYDFCYGIL